MFYYVYYFKGTWKLCPECRSEPVDLDAARDLVGVHVRAGRPVKLVPTAGETRPAAVR